MWLTQYRPLQTISRCASWRRPDGSTLWFGVRSWLLTCRGTSCILECPFLELGCYYLYNIPTVETSTFHNTMHFHQSDLACKDPSYNSWDGPPPSKVRKLPALLFPKHTSYSHLPLHHLGKCRSTNCLHSYCCWILGHYRRCEGSLCLAGN